MLLLFKRLKWLIVIISITTLTTSVVWYKFFYNKEIVILRPSNSKIKILPNDAGFIESDKNDMLLYEYIFNKDKVSKVTQIGSDPEQPINFRKPEDVDILAKIIERMDDGTESSVFAVIDNNDSIFPKVLEIQSKDHRAISLNHRKPKFFYAELNSSINMQSLEHEWKQIKATNGKILGQMPYFIHKKQVNDKFLYSIQVGKFEDFGSAKILCRKLISIKQNCLIVER